MDDAVFTSILAVLKFHQNDGGTSERPITANDADIIDKFYLDGENLKYKKNKLIVVPKSRMYMTFFMCHAPVGCCSELNHLNAVTTVVIAKRVFAWRG